METMVACYVAAALGAAVGWVCGCRVTRAALADEERARATRVRGARLALVRRGG